MEKTYTSLQIWILFNQEVYGENMTWGVYLEADKWKWFIVGNLRKLLTYKRFSSFKIISVKKKKQAKKTPQKPKRLINFLTYVVLFRPYKNDNIQICPFLHEKKKN